MAPQQPDHEIWSQSATCIVLQVVIMFAANISSVRFMEWASSNREMMHLKRDRPARTSLVGKPALRAPLVGSLSRSCFLGHEHQASVQGSVGHSSAGSLLPRRLTTLSRESPPPSTGSNNEDDDAGDNDAAARYSMGRGDSAYLVGAVRPSSAKSERGRRRIIPQQAEEGRDNRQNSTPTTGSIGGAVENQTRATTLVPIMSKIAVKARQWAGKGHLRGEGALAEAVRGNRPLAKPSSPNRTTPNAADLPPVKAEACAAGRLPARTAEQLVRVAVVPTEGAIVTGVVSTISTSGGQDGHLCSTASGAGVWVPPIQPGAESAITAKLHSAASGGHVISQPPMGSGRLPMNAGRVVVTAVGHQPGSHDSETKKCGEHSVTAPPPPSTMGREWDGTVTVSPREVRPMANDGEFLSELDGVRLASPPSKRPADEGGGRSTELATIAPSTADEDEL